MNKSNFTSTLFLLLVAVLTLSSCQAVGNIFKAGIWVGIIVVIVIVAIIFWLINKASSK